MEVVHNKTDLARYLRDAFVVSNSSPVLLDHFLDQAIEIDVDAVCDGQQVVIGAIMQHIEQAGVHSGDSACSLPPYRLDAGIQDEIRSQVKADGAGARRGRSDERTDGRAAGSRVCARSESTGIAYRAVRFEVHRRFTREDRRALHGGHVPRGAGIHEGDHPALRQRQRVGVSVQQVPRRRSDSRTRDEVDRRSHGCGRELRGGVREGDARERRTAAARRRAYSSA